MLHAPTITALATRLQIHPLYSAVQTPAALWIFAEHHDLPRLAEIEPANLRVLFRRDHDRPPGTRDGPARAVEGATRFRGHRPCSAARPPGARSGVCSTKPPGRRPTGAPADALNTAASGRLCGLWKKHSQTTALGDGLWVIGIARVIGAEERTRTFTPLWAPAPQAGRSPVLT